MRCSKSVVVLLAMLAAPAETRTAAAQAVDSPDRPDAAQHTVRGRVTEAERAGPVANVTVTVKGSLSSTLTDPEGRYELTAPAADDTLAFTSLGYQTLEVPIAGRSEIDVTLQATAIALEGLVVTGYQTVAADKLTGAVSQVDVEEIRATPTNSAIKALQGRVAGLMVSTDGDPMNEGATVRIRGVSTLGNNDPLYVIDGIPAKREAAHRLRSEDVESIQVLKDPTSASIYGARASNGVIVITTKSPARQPLAITYSSSLTTSTYPNRLDVLNTEQRGRALWQAAINDGADPDNLPIYEYEWERQPDGGAVLHRVIVPEYVGDPALGIRSADTNWYDEISRTGMIQEHNLSASISGDRGGALLSLGWRDDRGIVRGTEFQRLNTRINSSYNFFDGRLTIGENLSISHGGGTPMPSGLGGNPLALGLIAQPILPIRTESGGWAGPTGAGMDDRDNPVMLIDINRWDRNTATQAFGNLYANYDITPNLLATVRFGVDWQQVLDRDIQRRYEAGFLRRDINSLRHNNVNNFDWTINSTLNYTLRAGRHGATVLGGFEALRNSFSQNGTFREGFAIETRDFFIENSGTGRQSVDGARGGFSLASFFGKIDYDFADRYLASFTIRRDGSSRFGENNRFGIFPAVGLGWRVSNEPFFPSGGFVSDLKLRAGWGRTGNQEIDNNAAFSLFLPSYGTDRTWGPGDGTAYDLDGVDTGTLPSGFLRVQSGNPDLRWESTTEANVGVDFGLLDGRLSGSFDYFQRATEDILILPPFIAAVGDGGNRWVNGATVEAEGAELVLGWEDTRGGFRYGITGNLSSFTNRITRLPESVVRSFPGNAEETILGRSMNSIFGYVVDGIFQNEEEVDAHAVQPGKDVGRLRYEDLNGDGRIDGLDQSWLGDENPDFTYGISSMLAYRGFDLRVFFQGVHGNQIYNSVKSQTDFTSIFTGANFGTRVVDAWTPKNPNSTIPALSLANTNDELRGSSYFVEDGSYLKLRELTLGYTLPQESLPAVGTLLAGARVYVRGGNLFTLKSSSMTLPDPELLFFDNYPRPRTFTFGVDLSF